MPEHPKPDPALVPPQDLRKPSPGVIDQRQQQIDPAGHHRVDPNEAAKHSRKQPGGADVPEAELPGLPL